jgi:hypothetical protein
LSPSLGSDIDFVRPATTIFNLGLYRESVFSYRTTSNPYIRPATMASQWTLSTLLAAIFFV